MTKDFRFDMHTTGLSQYRNYRYPPLVDSPEEDLFGEETGRSYQEEFDNGFQEGVQKGHEQGYQDGLNQGIQAGLNQGIEQGKNQGWQDGMQQATIQVETALQASNQLIEQIQQAFHQHVKQQSEMIADLVLKVSRQVIRAELTLQPSQLIHLIEETLAQLPEERTELKIFLNPQDTQRLKDLVPEQVASWDLVPDDTLSIGSCRVVTKESESFADSEERLTTCIDAVKETLLADA